jgi:hypothetical protein
MSKKFSQFVEGEIPRITDIIVGLRDGDNTQFNYSGVNDEYDNPIVSYESYNEFGRNYIRFVNSPIGLPVLIQAQGIDADVGLTVSSKSNGNLTLISPNAGDVNITIGGSGDINFSTNAGRIYLNATDPLYGFTNDDTFSAASAEYAPSALAVKTYVDSHIATSNFFISTLVATTGNLNATYDNGVAGIGATLTANSNGAASIDGVSLSLGDIVLFKDQTSALENGVYSVIQVGSVGTPAIYERYIYFDQSAEIKQGYTTFTVDGTINAKKGYQVISIVNDIGIDDINYQQITIPSITSSTDNAIVRFDGASGGQIQNSGITISDANILSGATQINVDNLRLDGNILSSTDTNGPITIEPNGSGVINLNSPAVIINTAIQHAGDTDNQLVFGTDTQTYYVAATEQLRINSAGVRVKGNLSISDTQISTATGDLSILPFDSLSLYGDGDIDLLAGVSGGAGDLSLAVNGSGVLSVQTNSGNIAFDTTSGAYNFSVGGFSIMDISASGFRLGGAGTRVTSISNSASASGAVLMDADAIQLAIANQIGSAKSFRGGYDASSNLFPTTGGSGSGGAVQAGDVWVITTGGTLGGTVVSQGDTLIALVNTPGQTASNWSINANGVATWNGRAGVVTPQSGDYSFSLISGTAAVSQGGTGATSVGASGTLARSTGSAYGFTTATYPNTVATNDLLRGSATNVIAPLSTQNNSILTTSELGALRWTNLGLGEVPMGSVTDGVNAGTITGGTGMGATSISTNNITLNLAVPVVATNGGTGLTSVGTSGNVLTSNGSTWTSSAPVVSSVFGRSGAIVAASGDYNESQINASFNSVTTSTATLNPGNNYYTTYAGLCVMTLDATFPAGKKVRVRAGPSGATFKIAQNSGQVIRYGAQSGVSVATTTGVSGYLQSVDPNTTVDIECMVSNTEFIVTSNVNSLTVV